MDSIPLIQEHQWLILRIFEDWKIVYDAIYSDLKQRNDGENCYGESNLYMIMDCEWFHKTIVEFQILNL